MLKVTPTGSGDGKEYMSIYTSLYDKRIPVGINIAQYGGAFDGVAIAGAATYNIVTTPGNTGLFLTDLLVSLDKRTGGEASIRFTDDTNTEIIMVISTNDAPANFSIPFNGRWQGWQGARLDVVISGAVVGYISCGYLRTHPGNTFKYDAWDARRSQLQLSEASIQI
jgi:hypothetical protein